MASCKAALRMCTHACVCERTHACVCPRLCEYVRARVFAQTLTEINAKL